MERYIMNQRIRLYLHVSGAEIGRRVGLSAQTVSNYECGHKVRKSTEQLIENELARIILKCDDELLKEFCEYLVAKRDAPKKRGPRGPYKKRKNKQD